MKAQPMLGTIMPYLKARLYTKTKRGTTTIATCFDTPNAIEMAIREIRQHPRGKRLALWVQETFEQPKYLGTRAADEGRCAILKDPAKAHIELYLD